MDSYILKKPVAPPEWAFWERFLLDTMSRAAVEFTSRYTRPDGTLVWREEWPGMDGSDDGYESFFNFPLLAALGGAPELDTLARFEWEAVTRQFTAYGQIEREFDGYYDWMHHGESGHLFYFFGLSNPDDPVMVERAEKFARMYTGDDPAAPNYDRERRLIRSPITGSRGPRFVNSAEDWVTHRPVLALYPPPFEDVPGTVNGRADWNDDAIFAGILELINRRMMKGDVPLNLAATSLVTNAFLYTRNNDYREWVKDYTSAWIERARLNGGLLPDNVGLTGKIGETMDGKWWGGYYGWRWPHGWMNLADSAAIASSNALLLTGDRHFLDFLRSQLEGITQHGKTVDGTLQIPHRHGDGGWYDFRAPDPTHAIYLWFLSLDEGDRQRACEWQSAGDPTYITPGRGKGDNIHTSQWFHFLQGRNPKYPEAILRANYTEVCRRLQAMRDDTGNPTTWDVHHWQELNPVVCEGLVQLMLGAPAPIYPGGLLHGSLRYFDPVRERPGLPQDVAALVSHIDDDGIWVELVNLNPLEERRVILQAGVFGEHRFTFVGVRDGLADFNESGEQEENDILPAPQSTIEVLLAPAAGGRLRLGMDRYVGEPQYGMG
ncbi:MAG: hypothetical protein M3Y56_09525 [Armatimonadota bacterium]|nr:hypothetical protein [Armatimonadota bacterium]